jgi:hypothetical protein
LSTGVATELLVNRGVRPAGRRDSSGRSSAWRAPSKIKGRDSNRLLHVPAGGGVALSRCSLATGRRPWPPSDAVGADVSRLARAGGCSLPWRGRSLLTYGATDPIQGRGFDWHARTNPIKRLVGSQGVDGVSSTDSTVHLGHRTFTRRLHGALPRPGRLLHRCSRPGTPFSSLCRWGRGGGGSAVWPLPWPFCPKKC